MHKRLIPLVAVVLLLTVVPTAFASHCDRCKFRGSPYFDTICAPSVSLPGFTWCEDWTGACQTSGVQCTPHASFTNDLAAEFTVVSVERLDEAPQPAPTQLAELTTR